MTETEPNMTKIAQLAKSCTDKISEQGVQAQMLEIMSKQSQQQSKAFSKLHKRIPKDSKFNVYYEAKYHLESTTYQQTQVRQAVPAPHQAGPAAPEGQQQGLRQGSQDEPGIAEEVYQREGCPRKDATGGEGHAEPLQSGAQPESGGAAEEAAGQGEAANYGRQRSQQAEQCGLQHVRKHRHRLPEQAPDGLRQHPEAGEAVLLAHLGHQRDPGLLREAEVAKLLRADVRRGGPEHEVPI
uniref:Uncharacterized protein n=1 Tax=Spironucleus salmonicida TaxID=348837 RepID=V6LW72_9EUKA|eukprot:EST48481.1 Hypothetical protein SS50377_11312 [Spironucleus salmonicida]